MEKKTNCLWNPESQKLLYEVKQPKAFRIAHGDQSFEDLGPEILVEELLLCRELTSSMLQV